MTVRTQALDSFAPRVSLSSASSVLYGSTPPASLLVEDGRRPDDDVVICVVSPLGASKREGTPAGLRIMILLQVLLQKPCYDFSFL